jgi:hypothetical protein
MAVLKPKVLDISRTLSTFCDDLVAHKGFVTLPKDFFDVNGLLPVADGPAFFEILGFAQARVVRTAKDQVFVKQMIHCLAIPGLKGGEEFSDQIGGFVGLHAALRTIGAF